MGATINGTPSGGATAPSGSGVVTASGGAFVSPVASAATTRSTLGLGALATASSVTASQISDSTAAGQALVTAADASAQRTALGLSAAATASVGSTSGSIAAGNDARLNPVALASGFTDANNRLSRAGSVAAATDVTIDTGYTLLIAGYRNATVSSANERVLVNAFNSLGTIGWAVTVNANNVRMIWLGANIAGAGVGAYANLGVSLSATNAPFALAIQILASSIRVSLNGGAVSAVSRSGGTQLTTDNIVGIGADRVGNATQALNIAELSEIHLVQRAFGDADLQSYTLAASAAYSFWPSLTATDRSSATFSWSAVDGAVLRAGYGPITQTGTLKRRMPL